VHEPPRPRRAAPSHAAIRPRAKKKPTQRRECLQLNPDEWVWKNVKHDRIGKTGVTSKHDLKAKAIGALRRLQKRPGLVRAFFADPHLRYITA
jgi:hypothetical protein